MQSVTLLMQFKKKLISSDPFLEDCLKKKTARLAQLYPQQVFTHLTYPETSLNFLD